MGKVKLPPGIEWFEAPRVGHDKMVAWLINRTTWRIFAHRVEISERVLAANPRRVIENFVSDQVMIFGGLLMRNEAIEIEDGGELP
jgi:hypothetical protein